ncbi:MAG: DUF167 domain-containing protein [Deltaproteobacteria bacterium]|nr:DUF167 domain-containing protein [Deltaproteobacteria bacterium]
MAFPIAVTVKPNAKSPTIEKVSDTEYRASVNAAPEGGKANRKLIELLAGHFKVARSSIEILRGRSSRKKLIRID